MGGIGIWERAMRYGDPAAAGDYAAEVEELGYSAVWIPDVGGDLFGALGSLLVSTNSITVASGVLNLLQDPTRSAAGFHELVAKYGPRVLIGIGVSHAPFVNGAEPGRYRRPLARTREFLDALDVAPEPLPVGDRVLAALGPRMLELARDRSGGAYPYLVTPGRARDIARKNMAHYFGLPNYVNNWRRYGFGDADVTAPGSDRLIDALVAWGDEQAIAERVRQHRQAGADHVCIQVMVDQDDMAVFSVEQWRRLAPALV
jgi:Luciferase-like monooxygenase